MDTCEVVTYPGGVSDSIKQVLRDVEMVEAHALIFPDNMPVQYMTLNEEMFLNNAKESVKYNVVTKLGDLIDYQVDLEQNCIKASISLPLIRDDKFARLQKEIDGMRQRALIAEAEVEVLEKNVDVAINDVCQLRLKLYYAKLPFWRKWFTSVEGGTGK